MFIGSDSLKSNVGNSVKKKLHQIFLFCFACFRHAVRGNVGCGALWFEEFSPKPPPGNLKVQLIIDTRHQTFVRDMEPSHQAINIRHIDHRRAGFF